MPFRNVLAQSAIKSRLIQSANSGRIAHAVLFSGPEGAGKLALALAYAQYLNCEDRQEEDSCGKCRSCFMAQKYAHPDIHYSYPVIGTGAISTEFVTEWREKLAKSNYFSIYQWLQHINAENKQGNINVQECNSIIKRLSLKSYDSPYTVMIIWRAEYLGDQGNRLLKLIEEPPEDTVLILIAEEEEQVLNTILSRTQKYAIPRLSDQEISQGLQDSFQVNEVKSLKLSALAEGNVVKALELNLEEENVNSEVIIKWMSLCIKKNQEAQLIKWIDKRAKDGRESLKHFMQYCLYFTRQTLRLRYHPEGDCLLNQEEKKVASWLSGRCGILQLESMYQLFNRASHHIGRNANAKIVLLNLSIKFKHIVMQG